MSRSNRITSRERSRAPSVSRVSTNHHIFSLNNGTYRDGAEGSPLLKANVAEVKGPSRDLKAAPQRRAPVASPTVVLAQHANFRNPPSQQTMSIPPPNNLYRGAITNRQSSSTRPPHIPAHNSAPLPRPPVSSHNPPADVISAIEGWGAPTTPLPNNASGRTWQPVHAQSAQPPRIRAHSQLPHPHTVMLDTPATLHARQDPVLAPEPPHTAPPPPRTRSRSAARAQPPTPTARTHTTRPLAPTHRPHTPTARPRTPTQRARTPTARATAARAPPPPTSAPVSASTSLVTALASVANIDAVRARFSESMEQLQRRRELAYRRAREERQQVLQRELVLQQARERAAQEEAERRVRAEKERARQELVRERERRVALELARRESVRALGERAQTGLVLREEVHAEEEALQRAQAEVAALQLSLAAEERRVAWEEAVGAERERERWLRSVQHEGRRVAATAVKAGAEAEREDAVLALALEGERRRVEAEVRRLAMARAGGGALCVYTDVLQRVGGAEVGEDEMDAVEAEAEAEMERVEWAGADGEVAPRLLHWPASPAEARGAAYGETHGEGQHHSPAHMYAAHAHAHRHRHPAPEQHYAADEADDTQATQGGHADEEDEEADWLFSLVDAENVDDAVAHSGAVEAAASPSSDAALPSPSAPLDASTAAGSGSAAAPRSSARARARKPAAPAKPEKPVAHAWDAKPCKGAAWTALDTRDAPPRPTHTPRPAPSPSPPSSSSRSRTRSRTRPASSRHHDYSRPPPPPSALPLPASSLLLQPEQPREDTWQRVAGDSAVAARVAAPFDSVVLPDGTARPVSALQPDDVHALTALNEPPLPALPAPPMPMAALEYAPQAATELAHAPAKSALPAEDRRTHSTSNPAARTRSFTPSKHPRTPTPTPTPVSAPAPSPRSQTPRAQPRVSPRVSRSSYADNHRSASASSPRPSASFLASPRPGTRAPSTSSARAAPAPRSARAVSSTRTAPPAPTPTPTPTPTHTHTPAHGSVSARSSALRRPLATPTARLRAAPARSAATTTSNGCPTQDTLANTLANTSSGASMLDAAAAACGEAQLLLASADSADSAEAAAAPASAQRSVCFSAQPVSGVRVLTPTASQPAADADAHADAPVGASVAVAEAEDAEGAEEYDQAWEDEEDEEEEEEEEVCVAPSLEDDQDMGIFSCVSVVPHGHRDECPYDDDDSSASGTLSLSFAAQPALPLHTAEDAPAAPAQAQVLAQLQVDVEAVSQATPAEDDEDEAPSSSIAAMLRHAHQPDVPATPQLPLPPLPPLPSLPPVTPVTPTRPLPTPVLAPPSPSPPSPSPSAFAPATFSFRAMAPLFPHASPSARATLSPSPSPAARRTPLTPPCDQPSPSSLSLAYRGPLAAHAAPHHVYAHTHTHTPALVHARARHTRTSSASPTRTHTHAVSPTATALALARADAAPLPHPTSPKSPPLSPLAVPRARAVQPHAHAAPHMLTRPVPPPLSPQRQRHHPVESFPAAALTPVHAHTHARGRMAAQPPTTASLSLATAAQPHTQPLRRWQQRDDAREDAGEDATADDMQRAAAAAQWRGDALSLFRPTNHTPAPLPVPTHTVSVAPAPAERAQPVPHRTHVSHALSFSLPAPSRLGALGALPEDGVLAHSLSASPASTAASTATSSPQHLFSLGDVRSCPPSPHAHPQAHWVLAPLTATPAPATPIARSVATFHDELRRGISTLRATVLSPPRSLRDEQDDG